MNTLTLSVSDFVAILNQTLEFAYPSVIIEGELANFRVSKNRWVYFDLKDEQASVKFFGTVQQLPGPLEDGLMLQVQGQPKLHPQFGFSVTVWDIRPVGEGSLRRAAALLEAKLRAEGLFDPQRKRMLPYPPQRIGLITSSESAAYADFVKILSKRWGGMELLLADTQVQGLQAPDQIMAAIDYFNQLAQPPEVLVITRGGGSAEDLAVFNSEPLTRAIAASRIPTLVAIGHETDISLAELVADKRASTPSNAAELLVPDRQQERHRLDSSLDHMATIINNHVKLAQTQLSQYVTKYSEAIELYLRRQKDIAARHLELLKALSPQAALDRGFAIVRDSSNKTLSSVKKMVIDQQVTIELSDGRVGAAIKKIRVE